MEVAAGGFIPPVCVGGGLGACTVLRPPRAGSPPKAHLPRVKTFQARRREQSLRCSDLLNER